MTKTHPLVDVKCFDLAHEWLSEYRIINGESAHAEAWEDAVWDLASQIQQAIEAFVRDAEDTGRLMLRGAPDSL